MATLSLVIMALTLVAHRLGYVRTDALVEYGSCMSAFNETGLCVQLADCQFLMDVVRQVVRTPDEERQLKRSQCGMDNTQMTVERRVLVCCPDKYCKKAPIISSAVGHNVQSGNVLPAIGTCGTFLEDLIHGGTATGITDYPWMALIECTRSNGDVNFVCGGSLINSRYVITAGHCVVANNHSDQFDIYGVRLGEWNLDSVCDCGFDIRCQNCEAKGCQNCGCDCAAPVRDIGVEIVIVHPDYMPTSPHQYHDIALLRLAESIAYTDFIRPICLPLAQELRASKFENTPLFVVGWGLRENSTSSPVKLYASLRSFDLNACSRSYSKRGKIVNHTYQLCAGGEQGIDACGGDSGGPLMVTSTHNNLRVHFLAGIVSYGTQPCGLKNWPGVYTRIGHYIDWILRVITP